MGTVNLPTVRLNTYKDKDIIDDQQKHKNRKSERIREIYRKGLQMEKLAEQGLTIVSIQHLQYLEQMVYGMQQQGQNVPVYPIQQPIQQPNPYNPTVYQPTVPVQPQPNLVQQPTPEPQRKELEKSLEQNTPVKERESKQPKQKDIEPERSEDNIPSPDPVPQPPKTQETKQSPPPSPSINVEDDEDDEDDEFMSNLGSNFNF